MGRPDVSLVHVDDVALDDLGSARPRQALDGLMQLLLAWRQDVDAEPIGNLIEPETAAAVVQRAARRQGECA